MAPAPTAVVFGVALVLAGLGFGAPTLLVPGIGLLGLAAVAIAWVGLAAPRRLVRLPGPSRVTEDEPFWLRIRAEGKRLPIPGGELSDPVLDHPLRLGPLWDGTLDREVKLRGRGRRALEPARLVVRDPLSLWTRTLESEHAPDLLVLPRVDPVVVSARGTGGTSVLDGLEDGAASGQLDARSIELEVDGLRAYREGSPASRLRTAAERSTRPIRSASSALMFFAV